MNVLVQLKSKHQCFEIKFFFEKKIKKATPFMKPKKTSPPPPPTPSK